MCKQKWAKINESVQKFVGCVDFATRQRKSGETEDDIVLLAYDIYFQDHKVKFTLEHAWRVLQNDQKWCSMIESTNKKRKSKKAKVNGNPFSCSSNTACDVEDISMERPMGVKAAKAKERKRVQGKGEESQGSPLQVLQDMWVIKQQDLAMKDKISKQRLLDTLLARTEPLSENEIILKEKLTVFCNQRFKRNNIIYFFSMSWGVVLCLFKKEELPMYQAK